jgi:hypothetical protein
MIPFLSSMSVDVSMRANTGRKRRSGRRSIVGNELCTIWTGRFLPVLHLGVFEGLRSLYRCFLLFQIKVENVDYVELLHAFDLKTMPRNIRFPDVRAIRLRLPS